MLWAIVELFGELLLQLCGEYLAELFGRSVRAPFRRPQPPNPLLAALGYALFGAAAGALSLWLFPLLFVSSPTLRLVNLVLTPLLAGAVMALLGAWRRRHEQATIRLDSFLYGYVFALTMALVRFVWGG